MNYIETKISVLMITYGHENYIKKAIESVLNQKCDFELELIIADDCSPDNTGRIVKEIIEKHPKSKWIKYYRHEVNLGAQKNFFWCLNQAKSKYIALCEGDDYWTDPLKLLTQVSFLEANEEVSITCHNVEILDCRSNEVKQIEYFNEDLILDEKQIIKARGKITPTLSYVFRSSYFSNTPDWVFNTPVGDIPLMFYLMSNGKVFYFNRCMGMYRENVPGSWTVKAISGNVWKNFVFRVKFNVFIQRFNEFSDNKYRIELNSTYRSGSTLKGSLIGIFSYLYRRFFL